MGRTVAAGLRDDRVIGFGGVNCYGKTRPCYIQTTAADTLWTALLNAPGCTAEHVRRVTAAAATPAA